jgi:hypothetical protein
MEYIGDEENFMLSGGSRQFAASVARKYRRDPRIGRRNPGWRIGFTPACGW